MSEVYSVTDLVPMEKLKELLKDPAVKERAQSLGWNIPEIETLFKEEGLSLAKRGEVPITTEQCATIALSEYQYWRTAERTDDSICGMAAAANIYAAITFGQFAPWHPGYPKEEKKEV